LCELRRPIETSDLRRDLDWRDLHPSERAFFDNDAIRWWVPMVSEQGLVGLLLLGARLRGERFDVEDLQILGTLGNQAALAARNILLTEELRLQLEQTENSRRTLERMHRRLLLGREEEQKRLSRELHDGPVQQLIALRYQLHECLGEVQEDSELQRTLRKLRAETGELLNELRNLCSALRPPLLDAFGLASAIRSHCEQVGGRYGLRIRFVYDNARWQLPEDISVTLFRVYQEAMSNVARHANASQVVVELHKTNSTVMLEVQDDGVGLVVPDSLNHFATEGHFGLLGIRERVELLGGEYDLVSQPGQGATLSVQLPLRP
jgi:signal transduction histidine kinase